ncbi:extensin family protein, partial [Klebsiella pneumoniae]
STRLRYLSGVNTIHQASSYSCRTMSNRPGANMSEHSKGNALDIAKITLNNGTDIKVQKPGFFAFRQRGLLNNVRSDACDYFTTVLGPGYD